jgi:hypothetical protein
MRLILAAAAALLFTGSRVAAAQPQLPAPSAKPKSSAATAQPPPAAATAHPPLPYQDGHPIPNGYHVESTIREGPVIAGATTFGTGYIVSVVVGAVGLKSGSNLIPMFIPIVGPFITLGTGEVGEFNMLILGPILVLDGLLQTAGAVALTVGLASPKKVLVRGAAPAADTTPRIRFGGNRIAIEGRF